MDQVASNRMFSSSGNMVLELNAYIIVIRLSIVSKTIVVRESSLVLEKVHHDYVLVLERNKLSKKDDSPIGISRSMIQI